MSSLEEALKKATALTPIDEEAFYSHAYAQYQGGYLSQAAEAFELLCTHFPLKERHWVGLAASLQEDKEYERSLKAWAMAAFLNRKDPYPHFHAAECLSSLQNTSEALLALEEAKQRIAQEHPLFSKIELLQIALQNEGCFT